MILVDSCVLIDFTRTKAADAKLAHLFATLPVGVCGICRTELLAGARTSPERVRLEVFLNRFNQIAIEERVWDEVGDNLAALRRAGVNIPFPDVVLATVAIFGDFELWTRDAHFTQVQRALPALRLFAEPP
jgi:predicted nucleic acid-binding protein